MKNTLYIGLLLVLFNSAFATGPPDYVYEIEAEKAKWDSKKFKDISYTLKDGGVSGYSEYEIVIKNGNCQAMSRFVIGNSVAKWSAVSCAGHTIPELYERVLNQLYTDVYVVNFVSNKEFGYLEQFSVQPDTNRSDHFWFFDVSNFKATYVK